MYRNEEQVARKAEQMLETSLRAKTSSFADHVNRNSKQKSIKDATAVSKVQKYGPSFYMRSLSIKMPKHGFIQNAGVDTTRSGGSRKRSEGNTTYSFKSHTMKMAAKPFINDAVDSSGVKDFVMVEIARIRSEAIMVNVKKILENL
ncbi:hypothetical protein [Chryseobacterium sp. ZHDP1]|uniref:hypothetical protein n=1 Tax=Chryseobacterium sp. ZHDP1 TaxID=2838877 RepID=UPI001BE079A1|nr:hypothetical protein [Chryseobacterium sp. ZHDP1]QWA38890.1 hypothetical protein KKI44_01375 [Chryseobacterium sp. ZHDP1]